MLTKRLQHLGVSSPRSPTGALPLNPAGGLPSQTPAMSPTTVKTDRRLCVCVIIADDVVLVSRSANSARMSEEVEPDAVEEMGESQQ